MTMLQIQVDVRYKMATNIHEGYKHISVYEYEVMCMFYTYMAKNTYVLSYTHIYMCVYEKFDTIHMPII
jgi:hypothetical protein